MSKYYARERHRFFDYAVRQTSHNHSHNFAKLFVTLIHCVQSQRFTPQSVAYLTELLCPDIADISCSRWRVHPMVWGKLVKERNTKTLRELSKDYCASHETVRRTIFRAFDL